MYLFGNCDKKNKTHLRFLFVYSSENACIFLHIGRRCLSRWALIRVSTKFVCALGLFAHVELIVVHVFRLFAVRLRKSAKAD